MHVEETTLAVVVAIMIVMAVVVMVHGVVEVPYQSVPDLKRHGFSS
jgi:hypothetical protein